MSGQGRAQSPPTCGSFESGKQSNGKLLTAIEVAERWQVPKAHVYRLTREGAVPAVKLGRYYRYRLEAVEEFEAAGGSAADA